MYAYSPEKYAQRLPLLALPKSARLAVFACGCAVCANRRVPRLTSRTRGRRRREVLRRHVHDPDALPGGGEHPSRNFFTTAQGVDFDELRCPFGCHTIFVTKAAFRRHRVRMHKFRRAPKDKPEEKFESFSLTDDINHIIRRTNSTSNEFVVQTVNDTFEWRTLPLELPIVRTFWRRKKAPPMAWSCQKTFLR